MRPDSDRYMSFYQTSLGQSIALLISDRLAASCSIHQNQTIAFLGYGLPYTKWFDDKNTRCVHLMPASQGVSIQKAEIKKDSSEENSPAKNGFSSAATVSNMALVDDCRLPIPDCSIDSFVMIHALEHAARPNRVLREIWRVLAPQGQLAIIVPNRASSWIAFETTPFAYGRPWSKNQLNIFLRDHLMTPVSCKSALMLPPFFVPSMGTIMEAVEKPLRAMTNSFGGVLVSVSTKEITGNITEKRTYSRSGALGKASQNS